MADMLTHEVLYRSKKIVDRRSKVAVLICGAGALGSRLLDTLVCQGYKPTVVDCDKIKRHNLGNQNYGQTDIGKKKATQAANNIYRRFEVKVEGIDKKVTAANALSLIKGRELVVDVFDNAESRQVLVDACYQAGISCVHAGMSNDGFAEIEWDANYHPHPAPAAMGNEPCEYPLAVNLVQFTVAILAEVINGYVDRLEKRSIHFTLKDMHVHRVNV